MARKARPYGVGAMQSWFFDYVRAVESVNGMPPRSSSRKRGVSFQVTFTKHPSAYALLRVLSRGQTEDDLIGPKIDVAPKLKVRSMRWVYMGGASSESKGETVRFHVYITRIK